MVQADKAVNLLWTGGWDSTFRLLQLLLILKKPVQPYYMIDPIRQSTGMELLTMRTIKRELFKRYPETEALLLPTRYQAVMDIPHHAELVATYHRLLKRVHMGSQYEWLARFCEAEGITGVEIGIEASPPEAKESAAPSIFDFLRPMMTQSAQDGFDTQLLDTKFTGSDEYALFHYFHFPILNLTKMDFQQIAQNEGFADLMDMTWFCHRPRGNKPCGTCIPCTIAIEEGMGRRVPFGSHLRYYVHSASRSYVRRKFPQFYARLQHMKRRMVPA